jgi:hypothetical protein
MTKKNRSLSESESKKSTPQFIIAETYIPVIIYKQRRNPSKINNIIVSWKENECFLSTFSNASVYHSFKVNIKKIHSTSYINGESHMLYTLLFASTRQTIRNTYLKKPE